MSTIIEKIESKIDYLDFYSEYIQKLKSLGEGQYTGLCCFHEDESPSFSINVETGMWRCYAGCGDGNLYSFLERHLKISTKKDRIKWLCEHLGIPMKTEEDYNLEGTVNDQIWKDFHASLLKHKAMITKLYEIRGITLDTIKQFKLGFQSTNNRITIPVFDTGGKCRNIRYYAMTGKVKPQNKMLNHTGGSDEFNYGRMRLYPVSALKNKKVILCEGEMDAVLLTQSGFHAVTVTSGAGSFRKEWSHKYFRDKQVIICFDIDTAGKVGTQKVARQLNGLPEWIKIIDLSKEIKEPPNADVTDYFLRHGHTRDDFKILVNDAAQWFEAPEPTKRIRNIEHKKVSLADASHHVNALCNIEVEALVSGKDFPPYEIPNKLVCECDKNMGDQVCPFCPMFLNKDNKRDFILADEMDRGSLLNLIDIPDHQLFRNIRKQIGIPIKCDHFMIDIKTYANIEELRLIPKIDFSTDLDYEYVQQVCYHVGHGIKSNKVYTFKGIALPNPKTQQSTQLFFDAESAVDSIDVFDMSPGMYKDLKTFQPTEDGIAGVVKAYEGRYKDLEQISGIYNRGDIALAYDIVLHSVLALNFQKKRERGWMECLVLGDSGCGKTELAKSMVHHYGVGEFITGESTSVAGLLGGLSQTAQRWHINWGKIPLNNRRALFIDEMSGMTVDEIGLLSGVRSSGIAEITKIRTEKTMAQTRKIWISNTRKIGASARNLMEYPYGCVAVRELIGNLEDIRRFDFAVTAHSEEVDTSVYNRGKKQGHVISHTSEKCHNLILWIWSRKADQIKFNKEATTRIFELATEMGKRYYHGIPIVEAADQRLKIMRGGVSIAAMMFSTDDSGENILVKACHVEFFAAWLERIYNKDSMRYGEWSRAELSKKNLKDQSLVDGVVSNFLVEILLDNETVNQSTLIDLTGWDRMRVKVLLSTLIKNNALKRVGTSFYMKTEAFVVYLNKRMNGSIVVADKAEDGDAFASDVDVD